MSCWNLGVGLLVSWVISNQGHKKGDGFTHNPYNQWKSRTCPWRIFKRPAHPRKEMVGRRSDPSLREGAKLPGCRNGLWFMARSFFFCRSQGSSISKALAIICNVHRSLLNWNFCEFLSHVGQMGKNPNGHVTSQTTERQRSLHE